MPTRDENVRIIQNANPYTEATVEVRQHTKIDLIADIETFSIEIGLFDDGTEGAKVNLLPLFIDSIELERDLNTGEVDQRVVDKVRASLKKIEAALESRSIEETEIEQSQSIPNLPSRQTVYDAVMARSKEMECE